MIYIEEDQVSLLLNWTDTFKATEAAMKNVAKKRATQNARTFTSVLDTDNVLLTMPGYLEDENYGALGCKLVTMCPKNPQLSRPLPTINANITLFDENTGLLKAIVAGTAITTWRTAAASVVATKHLVTNRQRGQNILAIIGAGVQGKAHARAFQQFFDFTEIRVWNHNPDKARALVTELNHQDSTAGVNKLFRFYESNKDCVKDADVIVTATFANEPVVKFDWVRPGVHINAVGAGPLHHHSELEEKIYLNSDVYIDHWSGAKKELAGLEKLGVEFKGEIGSVITGDLPPSPDSNRITVFQSLGMAAEDCAMARMIYDLYVEKKQHAI